MLVQEYSIKKKGVDHLQINKVFARKGHYSLNEKHVVVYLYHWMIKNDLETDDERIKLEVMNLIADFHQSPAYTVMKLEHYAKIHFKKARNIMNMV